MFDPVDPKQSLPALEEGILQYWREEDIFKRALARRAQAEGNNWDETAKPEEVYSFYDGPPFATGLPHYGHLLAGTIKDVIPRYQTMRGKYVQRRFGWDCHGLPIENIIEQEHNIADHKAIEQMGVGKFCDLCRAAVQRYTTDWRRVVERMGRWVDMDWDYKTMDPAYMESMWWAFKQLHTKDLIYEGHKPMHICPRCVTPLSNFEVTQGYQDVTDLSVYVTMPLIDEPGTELLIWTTTAWTLPGNQLCAIHPKVKYAKVACDGLKFILAKDLVESVFGDEEYEILAELKAKDLIGKTYEPPFPYFKDQLKDTGAFRVVAADYVTTESGTGIVHLSPAFGEEDFYLGQSEGMPLLQHVTLDGKFTDEVTDFAGLEVKPKADPSKNDQQIAEALKDKGRLFKAVKHKHSYPHCWRCDSPLLNYATSSWFVSIESIKPALLKNNQTTAWVPAHIRDGRYGKWLTNARDWAISRNRYWGTPIPIWRNEEGSELDVVGSQDELWARQQIRFTKLSVLRHAESEGNTIPIYQGQVPGTDLTETGRAQAAQAATHFADQTIDVIYCSPLARAQQTAAIIAAAVGAEVVVDERLREVDFGEYEGKTIDFTDLDFLKTRRANKLESEQPESIYHFEGMETWHSVQERISDFLTEVLPRHRSEHVLVVTHADPIQNIKAYFTKTDPIKISYQPYPAFAQVHTFFWDLHEQAQLDLHKDKMDQISWPGGATDSSVNLTIVRHGQTEWNALHKMQGWADSPLTDAGREQVLEAATALKKEQFDVVIASDLGRAKQTAKLLAEALNLKLTATYSQFRERNIGDWSGKKKDEAGEIAGYLTGLDDSLQSLTPPGGESFAEFYERLEQGYKLLLEKYAGQKVLLVLHGGSGQMLRIIAENLSLKEANSSFLANAASYKLTINPLLERIPEVLDCWFESGSMPYAQAHFPFEPGDANRHLPTGFPANFIAEGVDQTRAWFYTLMVLSTALFNKSPFENVVVNGIVLAQDGKKMSKRLKNYPDPMTLVNEHGADAVRFALMNSPAVRGEDLRFSAQLVAETVRGVLLPLWNTYSFFVTYANAAGFKGEPTRRQSTHPLDRWILAEVQDLVNRMTAELDNYDLSATCEELFETIDALTNWYVRLSRRRFAGRGPAEALTAGGDKEAADQHAALSTLYDVLLTLSQLLAPFCPYITEAIYLNLVEEEHFSVHMTDWPPPKKLTASEQTLLTKQRLLRRIVSLGNTIRNEHKIKIRQPLAKATIAVPPAQRQAADLKTADLQLLKEELNVKEVALADDPAKLATAYVQVDARKVGPRLGSRVQEIIKAGKEGNFKQEANGSILILEETLAPDEAVLAYQGRDGDSVQADHGTVVSLDTQLTDELLLEGDARDVIRAVQRARKDAGYEFTDQITLQVSGADEVMASFGKLIAQETKATLGMVEDGEETAMMIGERKVKIFFVMRNA